MIRSLYDSILAEDFVYRPPYEQTTFTIKHVMQYHLKIVRHNKYHSDELIYVQHHIVKVKSYQCVNI